MSLGEGGDEHVLHAVGVLILVDHDVEEALLIALQQAGSCLEEVNRLGEQIVEVERVRPSQEPLILAINAGDDLSS